MHRLLSSLLNPTPVAAFALPCPCAPEASSAPAAGRTLSGPALWTRIFLLLGLALRMCHYLRNPAVWHDEGALVVNVLEKGYSGLLGPLRFNQAAPPLFLWLERGAFLLFGDSTFALRLVPLLASCAALLLLAWVAGRVLARDAVPYAVLLMACSDKMLGHTCEVKPYAVDVLVAASAVALFVATRGWPLSRRIALFALLSPLWIWLSYPGCFLCGGLLFALPPEVRRSERLSTWLACLPWTGVVAAACLLLALGPVHAQHNHVLEDYWLAYFPDWRHGWLVPLWAVWATVQIVDYCFRPFGFAMAPLAALGARRGWRYGSRPLVLLLVAPIALALFASCFHLYPYGGSRITVYALPALALPIAEAIPPSLRRLRGRRGAWALLVWIPLAAAIVMSLWRAVFPWPRAASDAASAYVLAHRRPSEPVTANDWEFAYYFRRLGASFTFDRAYSLRTLNGSFSPLAGVASTPSGRLWLVLKTKRRDERQALFARVASKEWRVCGTEEFEDVTVFYLQTVAGGRRAPRRPGR